MTSPYLGCFIFSTWAVPGLTSKQSTAQESTCPSPGRCGLISAGCVLRGKHRHLCPGQAFLDHRAPAQFQTFPGLPPLQSSRLLWSSWSFCGTCKAPRDRTDSPLPGTLKSVCFYLRLHRTALDPHVRPTEACDPLRKKLVITHRGWGHLLFFLSLTLLPQLSWYQVTDRPSCSSGTPDRRRCRQYRYWGCGGDR